MEIIVTILLAIKHNVENLEHANTLLQKKFILKIY